MGYVEEGDEATESPLTAPGSPGVNAITRQLDVGRDDDNIVDDEDDDTRLTLAEMEAIEARADTPDIECDTQSDSPA